MKTSFHLILISAEQQHSDELKILHQLFEDGLQTFHLRKPAWSLEQTQQFLEALPAKYHNRIVLHSHFQLADKFKVKGIHLNESNRKLIAQLAQYPIISTSFHSLRNLEQNTFSYEYVFLSPIFDSISKAEYTSKCDLKLVEEEITKISARNENPPGVIALGGINAQNVAWVKSAGFSGAALLGAVWQSENPVKSFLEIHAIVK